MKVLRVAFLSGAVLEFLTAIAIGLVAVTLGVRLLDGGISFEQAFLVLLLAPEFYRPLRELGVHRHAGMEGKAAAKRIVEILETSLPVRSVAAYSKKPTVQFTIRFTDLTYTYPGSHSRLSQGSTCRCQLVPALHWWGAAVRARARL